MSRIGNRTQPGLYTLSRFRELEAGEAQSLLEQQVAATDSVTVVRCVYKGGADFPEHFHPQEQLTIVERGSLEFRINGDTIVVNQGEVIALEASVRHATRVPNGEAVALNLFLTRSPRRGGSPIGPAVPTVVSLQR